MNVGCWVVEAPALKLGTIPGTGKYPKLSSGILGLQPKRHDFSLFFGQHRSFCTFSAVLLRRSSRWSSRGQLFLLLLSCFLAGTSFKTCSECHVRFERIFKTAKNFINQFFYFCSLECINYRWSATNLQCGSSTWKFISC